MRQDLEAPFGLPGVFDLIYDDKMSSNIGIGTGAQQFSILFDQTVLQHCKLESCIFHK